MLILSGYIDLPRCHMYWKMTEDSHSSTVTSSLTRNRFNGVLKNLHLPDNDNLNNSDKFAKVRSLIQMFNKNCLSNYITERHVSIEESMIPYHGRHRCKQYMQSEPVKFCRKLWVAATTNGYGIHFYPYVGKDASYNNKLELGGSVVHVT